MSEVIRPAVCVIGAGPGGRAVAMAAAGRGVPVVLIDQGGMGHDVRAGGLPAAALIAAAARAEAVRRASQFGVMAPRPAVDFAKVREHVHGAIAAVAPNAARERLTGLGVRVIAGTARFTGRDKVAVGDLDVQARHFVIATGSSPAIPAIPGLKETPHATTDSIHDLVQCPDHLLVVGGTRAGLELAQAFRRLGAAVTILTAAPPLADDDAECAAIVLDQLAREGIAIRSGVTVARIETAGVKVRVLLKRPDGEDAVDGSHILFATGRRLDTDGLDLAAAGIKAEAGAIVVDDALRTSNRRVYAIGEAAGASPHAHIAEYHAAVVIGRTLSGRPGLTRPNAIGRLMLTDPEFATVGLDEGQARQRHREIRVLRAAYHDNDRAQAERKTRGHIKIITAESGPILGAAIVGARAGEVIATCALAIQQGLDVQALGDLVLPYPTLAEIVKQAAASRAWKPEAGGLTSPWVRRIIASFPRFR